MSSKTMAKRAAAGTLALAVCLTGGAALASSAQAATGFKFDTRVAGDDRYQTAVAASAKAFPNGSDSVVLVNGDRTVDGLTASYVAGVHSAPILYVNSDGNTVSPETAAELIRLKATKAYIVGGTTVVSAALEAKLGSTGGTVVRYGGTDRYETAAKVAKSGTDTPSKVLVASGERFADALVVGPEAYQQHYPILLTSSTGVPSYTSAALKSIAAKDVKVIGGTAVVSDSTYTAVGGTVRLADDNRQGTAVKVAADAIANEGFSKASIGLVGNLDKNAADALVAAPLAGSKKTPLLFIDAGITGAPTATYLKAHAADLTGTGYVFGGIAAVPQADVDLATAAAIGTVTSSQSYTVSQDDKILTSLTGTRTYTVSGLTAGKPVFVALVTKASLTNGLTLDATRRNADLTTGAAAAKITAVNNVTPTGTAGTTLSYTPDSSSFTFTITGQNTLETVVPVVFDNTDADSQLSLNVAGTPKESYGIGGATQFKTVAASEPAEANAGTQTMSTNAGKVNAVYADGFTVKETAVGQTAVFGTFKFKDGDVYKLGAQVISKAQFLSILSVGDVIGDFAYYSDPTSTQHNTYAITTDAAPTAIAPTVTPSSTKLGQVSVTYATDAEYAPGTQYVLQRQQTDATGAAVAGAAGQFTTVDTRTVSTSDDQIFTETLVAGYYKYKLQISSPSFSGTAVSEAVTASAKQVTTTATLSAPGVTRLYLTSNTSDINNLSKGDVFKIVLTQPVSQPVAGSTFVLGGKTFTSTDATSSTAGGAVKVSINSSSESVDGVSQDAGKVLTVTLLADPVGATASTTAPLSFTGGLQLGASSGIGNNAGPLPTQNSTDNPYAKLLQDATS